MEIVFCFSALLVVSALMFWQVRSLTAELRAAREKILEVVLENVALRASSPYAQLYVDGWPVMVCRN